MTRSLATVVRDLPASTAMVVLPCGLTCGSTLCVCFHEILNVVSPQECWSLQARTPSPDAICLTTNLARTASLFMSCRHPRALPCLRLLHLNRTGSVRRDWLHQQAPFAASQHSGSPELIRHASLALRLSRIQTDALLPVTELTIPDRRCSMFRTVFDCLVFDHLPADGCRGFRMRHPRLLCRTRVSRCPWRGRSTR